MLGLFRRPKTRSARASVNHARLRLECLEGRALPSVSLLSGVTPGMSSAMMQASTATAPAITSFSAVEAGSTTSWTFSGSVSTTDLFGVTVRFGGLPSLAGKSCTLHADGTFSMTVNLQPGESGQASAQAVDQVSGLASAIAYCMVNPVVNFAPTGGGGTISN